MLFGRRADTVGGGGDRQMQGAKRKSMLVGRTKSRREYLVRRINHSTGYTVSHLQVTSFVIDVLQACWLFDICTAFKVQNIEIFSQLVTHSKPFSKRFYRFVVCLLTDKLVGSLKFLYQTTVCEMNHCREMPLNTHAAGQSVFVF